MIKKLSVFLLIFSVFFLASCALPGTTPVVETPKLPLDQQWLPEAANGDWGMYAGVAGYYQSWVSTIVISEGQYKGSKVSYSISGSLYIMDGTQSIPSITWNGSAMVSSGKILTKK